MPNRFYVLRGFEGCVSVYCQEQFDKLLEQLSSLSYLDEKARSYVRIASSSVNELEVDSHGRISLSKDLVDAYKIQNEVVIIGVIDHFEIWDKTSYTKYHDEKSPLFEELASSTLAK
jgi:MraZ protein